MRLPIVRVQHPVDPAVPMWINEADLTDAHVRWDEEEVQSDALRVSKGPRGRWYVKSGKENVAGPFATEDEARAEIA